MRTRVKNYIKFEKLSTYKSTKIVLISLLAFLIVFPSFVSNETVLKKNVQNASLVSSTGWTGYVAIPGSNEIIPFNTVTENLASPITVGQGQRALAITPNDNTLYICNQAGTISYVNINSGSGSGNIGIGGGSKPYSIAITPRGTVAYVADYGGSKVVPVNTVTNSPGSTIGMPSNPDDVVVTPDGKELLVTVPASNLVEIVSTATNSIVGSISIIDPMSITIDDTGQFAYVASQSENEVFPVSLSTNSVGQGIKVGNNPVDVAASPSANLVYVANETDNTVSAIDTKLNKVIATVPVGKGPIAIALTPDGKMAYVTNTTDGTITPIVTATNTTNAVFNVGVGADAIAIDPDQAPVAELSVTPGAVGSATSFDASASTVRVGTIASYSWNFGDGSSETTIVPTATHTYIAAGTYLASVTETDSAGTSTTRVFLGQSMSKNGGPIAVASRDVTIGSPATPGWLGFVANFGSNTVSVFNVSTNAIVATVPVGVGPAAVAISPDAKSVYVANSTDGTVSVIDVATLKVVNTFSVGTDPDAIAISPDGSSAFVALGGSNSVVKIELNNDSVSSPISVGTKPDAIAINGAYVFVANYNSGNVSVIDSSNSTVFTTIPVGTNPFAIETTPNDAMLYVVNKGSQNVTPIDSRSLLPMGTITVGANPDAIAISPDGNSVYVASPTSVSLINPVINTVSNSLTAGVDLSALAITPNGTSVYLVDETNGSVTPSASDLSTQSTAFTVGTKPDAIAITPDQGPIASLSTKVGAPGSATTFDASGSTVAYGSISVYSWNFGDGSSDLTTVANSSHVYSSCGTYYATVTEVSTGSASSIQVFTGQTTLVNGSVLAVSTVTVNVPGCPKPNYEALVSEPKGTSIEVLNLGNNAVSSSIALPTGVSATDVFTTQSSQYALVTNGTTQSLDAISNLKIGTSLLLNGTVLPSVGGISPDGNSLYLASSSLSQIVPIALNLMTQGQAISIPAPASSLVVTVDGRYLLASIPTLNEVVKIDLSTKAIVATLNLSGPISAMSLTPNGAFVLLISSSGSKVYSISIGSFQLNTSASTVSSPSAIVVTSDGQDAILSQPSSVSVVSVASLANVSTVALGVSSTQAVQVTPDGSSAYIVGTTSNETIGLNISSASLDSPIALKAAPSAIVILPDQAPVASLDIIGIPTVGYPTTFDAYGSQISNGEITNYSWTFGDGSTASTSVPSVQHTFTSDGSFTATVTETDSSGNSTTTIFNGNAVLDLGSAAAQASLSFSVLGVYVPITPTRVCDTRFGTGIAANQCNSNGTKSGALQDKGILTVQIPNENSDNVPTTALAAVINITAISSSTSAPGGYLTVWPTGSTMPVASTVNFTPGDIVPNLSEIALGTNGDISIYNYVGPTDVLIDVEGYVGSYATTGGLFDSISPVRICDTRKANGTSIVSNQCDTNGNSTLTSSNETIKVQIGGLDSIPSSSLVAVVLNVTATNTSAWSFFTVWPSGTEPVASNLNWTSGGETVANRVIVSVSSSGSIEIANGFGNADLIVDVSGYYESGNSSNLTAFTGETPTRICDTRANSTYPYQGQTLNAGSTLAVQVSGRGGVPSMNSSSAPVAAVLNVTATNTTSYSYATIWPDKTTQPPSSDLNWSSGGVTRANLVIVKLGSDGMVDVFNSLGSVDIIIDVVGWYSAPISTVTSAQANLNSVVTDANTAYTSDASNFGTSNTDLISQLQGLQSTVSVVDGTVSDSYSESEVAVTATDCTTGTMVPLQNGANCQEASFSVFSPSNDTCYYEFVNNASSTPVSINTFPGVSNDTKVGTYYSTMTLSSGNYGCSPVVDDPMMWNSTSFLSDAQLTLLVTYNVAHNAIEQLVSTDGGSFGTSTTPLYSQLQSLNLSGYTFVNGENTLSNSLTTVSVTATDCTAGTGSGTPLQNGTNCGEESMAIGDPVDNSCFYEIIYGGYGTSPVTINGLDSSAVEYSAYAPMLTSSGCSPVSDDPTNWGQVSAAGQAMHGIATVNIALNTIYTQDVQEFGTGTSGNYLYQQLTSLMQSSTSIDAFGIDGSTNMSLNDTEVALTATDCTAGTGSGTPLQNGTNCQIASDATFDLSQYTCYYLIVDKDSSNVYSWNGDTNLKPGYYFATLPKMIGDNGCSAVNDNPTNWAFY